MDNVDPNAQGTQAPAADNAGQPAVPQENPNSGFQARIDELTARFHESQRTVDAQNLTIQQLIAAQAAAAAQPQYQVQQEPVPEMDPEEQRKLDYLIKKSQAPLMEEIQRLQGMMGTQLVQGAATHPVLQQYNRPELNQRVQQLVNDFNKRGLIQRGIATVDDAVKIAVGEFAMKEFTSRQPGRDERGRFNGNQQVIAQQGVQGGQGQGAPNGVNPDSLPVNDRVAYYEKLLGEKEF